MSVMSKYENAWMFGRGRLRVNEILKGNERLLIVYLGLMHCVKRKCESAM